MGPARGSWNRSKRFPTPHCQQQVEANGAIGFRCFSSTIEGHVTFGDFEGARKGCSKTISVIEVIGFEIILKKILAKCAMLPLKVKNHQRKKSQLTVSNNFSGGVGKLVCWFQVELPITHNMSP